MSVLRNAFLNMVLTGQQAEALSTTSKIMRVPQSASFIGTLASGTGSGQANKIASVTGTLVANTLTAIDLYYLTNNSVIAPLKFTSVKGIMIQNLAASPANLQVGDVPGTSTSVWNGFISSSGVIPIEPAGAFALFCGGNGVAVTGASKKLMLKSTGAAQYQIDIVGVGGLVVANTVVGVVSDGGDLSITFSTPTSAADFNNSQVVVVWDNADGDGPRNTFYAVNGDDGDTIVSFTVSSGQIPQDVATYSISDHPEITNPTGSVTTL